MFVFFTNLCFIYMIKIPSYNYLVNFQPEATMLVAILLLSIRKGEDGHSYGMASLETFNLTPYSKTIKLKEEDYCKLMRDE
jgi:hypothetical protein